MADAFANFPFAIELVNKVDGSPRLGLVLHIEDVDNKVAPISLVESGNGWYYSESVPKGVYRLYELPAGETESVFTGVYYDFMAGVIREDNGYTETVDRRILEQYKIPQSFGPLGENMRSEQIIDAIQRAVDSGVKRVVLPPGSYYIDSTVALNSVDFCLDGCGSARFTFPAGTDADYPMLTIGASRVQVLGIELDGTNMVASGVADVGLLEIVNSGAYDSIVSRCNIHGANCIGINLEQGKSALLFGNKFGGLSRAVRINTNYFKRVAIAGCGAEDAGDPAVEQFGSGALVYEAAGNYGITAYIENIGTVTGGDISNATLHNNYLQDNEFQGMFFGCKRNPANNQVVKTNDSQSAFYITRRNVEISPGVMDDVLDIRCADTSALNNGDTVLFTEAQSIQIDDAGNIKLSDKNIGGIHSLYSIFVNARYVFGELMSANAVNTSNIRDQAVTNDKITSVAWSKVTGVPSQTRKVASLTSGGPAVFAGQTVNVSLSVPTTKLLRHGYFLRWTNPGSFVFNEVVPVGSEDSIVSLIDISGTWNVHMVNPSPSPMIFGWELVFE